MRHQLPFALAFFVLTLCPVAANAAASDWQDIAGGRVRIVVAEPSPGAKAVQAMLQVDLQPGWKTYWRDPGDAGVPLQLDILKSVNAALTGIDYPTPHRFDDGTSVWAGYKEPVSFGLRIVRNDTATPITIAGNAFLGVCDEICVPVQFEFSVDVKDSAVPTMHQELVAMALQDLPAAASKDFGVTAIAADIKTVRMDALLPEGVAQAELFLAAPEGFQFAAPVLQSLKKGVAQFEANVLFSPETSGGGPKMIAYTLVTDKGAVSGEIAFSQH